MVSSFEYMYIKILLIHECIVVVGINITRYDLKKAKEERMAGGYDLGGE